MGGMFTSGENAVFIIPGAVRLITPAVLGDPLDVSYSVDPNAILTLLDGGNNVVYDGTFLAAPGGITWAVNVSSKSILITIDKSLFSVGGQWSAIMSPVVTQFAKSVVTFTWGGIADDIVTTKTEVTSGGALYDMLFQQLSDPTVHNTVAEWAKSAYTNLEGGLGSETVRSIVAGLQFLAACSWTTNPTTGVVTLTDGTTTKHLTVSNADGTPFNPSQILNRTIPT